MEKRYAIVRVDRKCPDLFEKIKNKFVCEINGDYKFACKNCRYGDTKEQLIRKIEQVIFKIFKDYNGFMARYLTPHLVSFAYKIAKEIVEFLGVEE